MPSASPISRSYSRGIRDRLGSHPRARSANAGIRSTSSARRAAEVRARCRRAFSLGLRVGEVARRERASSRRRAMTCDSSRRSTSSCRGRSPPRATTAACSRPWGLERDLRALLDDRARDGPVAVDPPPDGAWWSGARPGEGSRVAVTGPSGLALPGPSRGPGAPASCTAAALRHLRRAPPAAQDHSLSHGAAAARSPGVHLDRGMRRVPSDQLRPPPPDDGGRVHQPGGAACQQAARPPRGAPRRSWARRRRS